jgi:membrane protein implicated in regulation of membrane protease activity
VDRFYELIWTTAPTGWHWLAFAAVLGVVEALTPATLALWFALAALIVGRVLFAAPNLAFVFQVLAFALLALAGVLLWFGVFRQRRAETDPAETAVLNDRLLTLIGKRGVVLAADAAGNLRIRIGDTSWSARPIHADSVPAVGTAVEVTEIREGVPVVASSEMPARVSADGA